MTTKPQLYLELGDVALDLKVFGSVLTGKMDVEVDYVYDHNIQEVTFQIVELSLHGHVYVDDERISSKFIHFLNVYLRDLPPQTVLNRTMDALIDTIT